MNTTLDPLGVFAEVVESGKKAHSKPLLVPSLRDFQTCNLSELMFTLPLTSRPERASLEYI